MLGLAAALAGAAEDLAPFLAVHRKAGALAEGKQWAEAAKLYGAFAAERPADPCAPLALILQGTLLRRELKQTEPARAAFARAAALPAAPFDGALQQVARRWLAWFEMADLDAALRKYYVERVEYPKSLDALVERKLLKAEQLADPWGNRFAYEEAKSRIVPKMAWQNYRLRSTAIELDSRQFALVLKESAEFARRFRLKTVNEAQPMTAVIEPADKTKKMGNVAEGETFEGAKLVKLTRDAAILVDREHVAVLTK